MEIIENKAIISKPLALPFAPGYLQEIITQIKKTKIETFLPVTKIKEKLNGYNSSKTVEKKTKAQQINQVSTQEKSLLNPKNSLQISVNFSEKESSEFYLHKTLPLGKYISKKAQSGYFSLDEKLHQKLLRPWIPNKIFTFDPMKAETIKLNNNTLVKKNDYWLLTQKDRTKKIITSEKLNNYLNQLIVLLKKIKPITYADNLKKTDFILVFFSKNNKNQQIEVQKIKDGYYLRNQLWPAIFQLKTEKDILQILKF